MELLSSLQAIASFEAFRLISRAMLLILDHSVSHIYTFFLSAIERAVNSCLKILKSSEILRSRFSWPSLVSVSAHDCAHDGPSWNLTNLADNLATKNAGDWSETRSRSLLRIAPEPSRHIARHVPAARQRVRTCAVRIERWWPFQPPLLPQGHSWPFIRRSWPVAASVIACA